MRNIKVCRFLFIIAEIAFAVSQTELKEDINSESTRIKTPRKELNMEDLYEKMEEMILLIEDNRLLSWNLLKNSIIGLKDELTATINEAKSDIVRESEKLTSEIFKVNLEVKNVELKIDNVTNENKILANELNELKKQFTVQSELDNNNIVTELTELKELNYNKTNIKCENNINEFHEVTELMIGLAGREKNCAELLIRGDRRSGIRIVSGIDVVCDQVTDGGGWTIFQTRDDLNIRENFYRNWDDYSNGFGNLSGEFWLGLEKIHMLTKYTNMELRVEIEDDTGAKRFAKYESFSIENSRKKFRLNIGSYLGTAGDSLSKSNQMNFSTKDQDNDIWHQSSCAKSEKGAWWYRRCGDSNLNGFQLVGDYSDDPPFANHGIYWAQFRGGHNSMRRTKMMFRPQKK